MENAVKKAESEKAGKRKRARLGFGAGGWGKAGKGFGLPSVVGRWGDALRLVRADTAAFRKFIRLWSDLSE